MPIYEYRCDDCEALFEVMQKMSDDPLEVCETCGGHLRKVLHPVAIHFKGSGFYTTDYGRGSTRRPGRDGADGGSTTEGASGAETDSVPGTKPADKPAEKPAAPAGGTPARAGSTKAP